MFLRALRHRVAQMVREHPNETAASIAALLRAEGIKEREVRRVLTMLVSSGEVLALSDGKYVVYDQQTHWTGTVTVDGRGAWTFVEEGKMLPPIAVRRRAQVMHGDVAEVVVRFGTQRGVPVGDVVRIVKRAHERVMGTVHVHWTGGATVRPDDRRIADAIAITDAPQTIDRHRVVVHITSYPDDARGLCGRIVDVIGAPEDGDIETRVIVHKYGLQEPFSERACREADACVAQELDVAGRIDLRTKTICTIDGADAKDLDDAISIDVLPNGHVVLGVHIADVAHFVRPGTALDREAYARGTSVYLVDHVVPMLPHALSQGVCSLLPDVDRLTVTIEMEIHPSGAVVRYAVYPSVIRSVARLTYDEVFAIVSGHGHRLERQEVYTTLHALRALAETLREKRMRRGALDLDIPEVMIAVDAQGSPIALSPRPRTIAHAMIEEAMLCANETVARMLHTALIPCVYRVHEQPDGEKREAFVALVEALGIRVRSEKGERVWHSVLASVRGMPCEAIVSRMMLRSMKQARYDDSALGHFGLAAEHYAHCTSPIRRYPDLLVHRVLRQAHWGARVHDDVAHMRGFLHTAAHHCTERERNAVQAERESIALKKAQWMMARLGQQCDAVIVSVAQFGLFVDVGDTVEALLRLSAFDDDYYHVMEHQGCIRGERTGKTLRIGDRIRVVIERVRIAERAIDVGLVKTHRMRRTPLGKKRKRPLARQTSKQATRVPTRMKRRRTL
jgi:ribonuclease R